MKFTPKFLQGGEMPVEEPVMAEEAPMEEAPVEEAPAEGGAQQDPLMMLAQGAAQALQTQDCQIAMQVCQGFLQLVQQMAGQLQAPMPEEPQGEPVFARRGAKLQLKRRIKK